MSVGYLQEVPLTDALIHNTERGACPERYQGYVCTLSLNHWGPHVAHISAATAVCAWVTLDPDLEMDEGL